MLRVSISFDSWGRDQIFDTRFIQQKRQHLKNRTSGTMPLTAVAQRRFASYEFIWTFSTKWVSSAANVRPAQTTQEKCTTSTRLVYDRFSSTPAGQKSPFSSRTGSHSLLKQLHKRLIHLRWHMMKTSNLGPSSAFLWFFSISSLFTSILWAETIQI